MTRAAQTVPDWAIGCTDRAYISLAGGERDPSIAIWIQTESQYFDLRIPHDRPRFARRQGLHELGRGELMQLARQSGDTGVCTIENGVATWKSASDRYGFYCEDVAIFPETGRLEPRKGVIYEYETPESPVRYEEAWVRQPFDHGLVVHLTLHNQHDQHSQHDQHDQDRPLGVLVVTGRYAGFVECATSDNRSSLEAQLEAAGEGVQRMRDILSCEASYAVRPRAGAPFVIRHSNFPFREGQELDVPILNRRILERGRTLPARRKGAAWRVESWFVAR